MGHILMLEIMIHYKFKSTIASYIKLYSNMEFS